MPAPTATAGPAWDLDAADDFLVADGLETVALYRQTRTGGYEPAVFVRAAGEEPNRKTAAGLMEGADRVWHLHGPDVGPRGVHRGDRITDHAGNEWDAGGATLAGLADQWRVPTTKVPAVTP